MSIKRGLLMIDAQNDFLGNDDHSSYAQRVGAVDQEAALPVKGGVRAMRALANLVGGHGSKFQKIILTEDWHSRLHSAHPYRWRNSEGHIPYPFTVITASDVAHGRWRFLGTPEMQKAMLEYLIALEASGRQHRIWPPHCVKGTWGQLIYEPLAHACAQWAILTMESPLHFQKGGAEIPEHFGAVHAEVVDRDDATTQPNWEFIDEVCDTSLGEIVVAGLALDYCVARTVEQLLNYGGYELARKLVILTDCTAAIDEEAGTKFLESMHKLGVRACASKELCV